MFVVVIMAQLSACYRSRDGGADDASEGSGARKAAEGGVQDKEGGECKDRINNIAGSMSCRSFLRSFAYQYCRHKYIRKVSVLSSLYSCETSPFQMI